MPVPRLRDSEAFKSAGHKSEFKSRLGRSTGTKADTTVTVTSRLAQPLRLRASACDSESGWGLAGCGRCGGGLGGGPRPAGEPVTVPASVTRSAEQPREPQPGSLRPPARAAATRDRPPPAGPGRDPDPTSPARRAGPGPQVRIVTRTATLVRMTVTATRVTVTDAVD